VDDKKMVLKALGSRFYLKDQKLSVELAKPFKLIQEGMTNDLVVHPRFATLEIRINTGHSAEEVSLIKNGGGFVDEVRHPGSLVEAKFECILEVLALQQIA
jgi:hypothetical protein